MKSKVNKWLRNSGIALIALIVFIAITNTNHINISYIRLFRKSVILDHYNNHGQLDGEYMAFTQGNLFLKSNFKNGQRDGWCIWYDKIPGLKRREIQYRKGVPEGVENVYYPNGNLNYSTQWKNGRYLNSEYHYLDNGGLNTYNAFDLSKIGDNGYCYIAYDSAGKFHQILGSVFSSYIYSVCSDSTISLTENKRYKCLSDLYVEVATPPRLKTSIEILVNKVKYSNSDVRHNTIVIPNIFDGSGKYEIAIYGRIQTKHGTIIKSDTLKTNFFKE